MPDWASLALNVVVIVAGLAYGAGIWRERVEAKDIKRRVTDLEEWKKTYAAETEDRFDRANARMSKLASAVQGMPDQIEDRVAKRYYEAGTARAEIAGIDRRLHIVEYRLTIHDGKAIHHDR